MAAITCLNCGFQQAGGDRCQKCSALFAYRQAEKPAANPEAPTVGVAPADSIPGERRSAWLLRRAHLVTNWLTLAALIVIIFLVVRRPPAPPVATSPQATEHVNERLNQEQTELKHEQVGSSAGQPHELRLNEAELNAYLAANLNLKRDDDDADAAQPPLAATPADPNSDTAPSDSDSSDSSFEQMRSSVKDLKVTMSDDRVQAHVVFNFHGEDLSLMLDGRLHVRDGYLRFDPVAGKLGSLPLPQSTLDGAIQQLLDSPENREKLRVPPDVSDVRIESGELVVTYNK